MSDLDYAFNKAIKGIEALKEQKEISKAINKVLDVIYDVKIHQFEYDKVLNKIVELEKILAKKNFVTPDRLDYMKASIYYELGNNDKAEDMFLNLIDNKKVSLKIKNLSHFALCKLYIRDIDPDNDFLSNDLEKVKKFKKHYSYLKSKMESRKLEEYISRNFSELKTAIEYIDSNKSFYVFLPNKFYTSKKYNSLEEIMKKEKDSTDILINFSGDKHEIYIKGQLKKASSNQIKLFYLLSKGTTIPIIRDKIGYSENSTSQRKKEIKEILKENGINVLDSSSIIKISETKNVTLTISKISPSVKIKIIYDNSSDIHDWLIQCEEMDPKTFYENIKNQ